MIAGGGGNVGGKYASRRLAVPQSGTTQGFERERTLLQGKLGVGGEGGEERGRG